VPASDDGAFSVDTKPFRFDFDGDVLFGSGLHEILGSHRKPGGALRFRAGDRRDADVAASLQVVLEERALGLCRKLHERTGLESLCLAGSLAANRRLVERLRADGPFRALHVAAASGKAGAALGAAYLGHALLAPGTPCSRADGAGLGPRLDGAPEEGAEALGAGATAEAARRLEAGQILGWVTGALEFADAALGARLILGSAAAPDARERLLGAVQRPEAYLRCRVLLDAARAHEEFDLPTEAESLLREGRLAIRACEALRRAAPSAIAPDGTVVVQLVDAARQPALHALLEAVRARSGVAVLLAEAFHLRGLPVVRTELDAVEAFGRSTLDALFVEDRLYASA
jgi:carbamoyltransferase